MTQTLTLSPGFAVLDGNASVIDRVERHLRFFFGEDFFRPLAGVPYNRDVFDRGGIDDLLDVVRREALKVRDVAGATARLVEVEPRQRVATIEVTVTSEFGRGSVRISV